MNEVVQLCPGPPRTIDTTELLAGLRSAPPGLPFSPERMALAEALSDALLADARSRIQPELVALAWFLRRASLRRLEQDYRELHTDDTLLVPRGLSFHIPPANVDTIPLYAWALSMLVGNRDLVRLSSRPSPLTDLLLDVVRPVLDRAPAGLRQGVAFVRYGHDAHLTEAFSAACDLRLVWGSDETIRQVRKAPLPPWATELAFFERWSFCVLSTSAWTALTPEGQRQLADSIFTDAYPFGQQGCASPRLLAWVGEGAERCGHELAAHLAQVLAERGYLPDAPQVAATTAFAWAAALDLPVNAVHHPRPGLWLLDLEPSSRLPRQHPGGGLFFQVRLERLDALVPLIERSDQTMSCFGFDPAALAELARALGPRCPDRIVSVGYALRFHRYWDGYDLLDALSRRIHLLAHA